MWIWPTGVSLYNGAVFDLIITNWTSDEKPFSTSSSSPDWRITGRWMPVRIKETRKLVLIITSSDPELALECLDYCGDIFDDCPNGCDDKTAQCEIECSNQLTECLFFWTWCSFLSCFKLQNFYFYFKLSRTFNLEQPNRPCQYGCPVDCTDCQSPFCQDLKCRDPETNDDYLVCKEFFWLN